MAELGPLGEIPQPILDLAKNHASQLRRLEGQALDAVTRRLDAAAERVMERGHSFDSFKGQQARIIDILSELTRAETTSEMEDILRTLWQSGSKLAPAQTEDELNEWLQYYGHEARPLNLQAVVELDEEILIERIPRSLANYGPAMARSVRDTLTDAVAERAFSEDMVDRVADVVQRERWKADRIVRTELSEAYNRSHMKTLEYAQSDDGLGLGDDMQKSAIAALDARMDDDSIPVHGQVRELGEPFVDGDGRQYQRPPGRPNDREKMIPWLGEGGANELARRRPQPLSE